MYGRRRVGKSAILRRFCSDRRSVYIECAQGSLDDNLRIMAGVFSSLDGAEHGLYRFIAEALEDIESACRIDRAVIVFDELPYLLTTGVHIASSIQHFMDSIAREGRVTLVGLDDLVGNRYGMRPTSSGSKPSDMRAGRP